MANTEYKQEIESLNLSNQSKTDSEAVKKIALKYLDDNKNLPTETFDLLVLEVKNFLLAKKVEVKLLKKELELKKKSVVEKTKNNNKKLDKEIQTNISNTTYLIKSLESVRDEIRDSSHFLSIRWANKKSKEASINQLDGAVRELRSSGKNLDGVSAYRVLQKNVIEKELLSYFYPIFDEKANWKPDSKTRALKLMELNIGEAQITEIYESEMKTEIDAGIKILGGKEKETIAANVKKQMQKTAGKIMQAADTEWNKSEANRDKIKKENPSIKDGNDLFLAYTKLHEAYITREMTVKYVSKKVMGETNGIAIPDSKKEIWEKYKNATNAKDSYNPFKWSLSSTQKMYSFFTYDVPAMLVSGGVAGQASKYAGRLALRGLSASARAQKLAGIGVKTSEIGGKTLRTAEIAGLKGHALTLGSKAVTEGFVFTVAHEGIRNQAWFANSPDWGKQVLTNSLMFGSFGAADKLINKVYKGIGKTQMIEKKAIDGLIKQGLTAPALYYGANCLFGTYEGREGGEIGQELLLMGIMGGGLHYLAGKTDLAGGFKRAKLGDLDVKISADNTKAEITNANGGKFKFNIKPEIKNKLINYKEKITKALKSPINSPKAKPISAVSAGKIKVGEGRVEKIKGNSEQIKKLEKEIKELEEKIDNDSFDTAEELERAISAQVKKTVELEKLGKKKYRVDIETINDNVFLDDASRLLKTEEYLGRKLEGNQGEALLENHKIGQVFNNTLRELRTKKKNLIKAGFTNAEINKLLEHGILGGQGVEPMANAVSQSSRRLELIRERRSINSEIREIDKKIKILETNKVVSSTHGRIYLKEIDSDIAALKSKKELLLKAREEIKLQDFDKQKVGELRTKIIDISKKIKELEKQKYINSITGQKGHNKYIDEKIASLREESGKLREEIRNIKEPRKIDPIIVDPTPTPRPIEPNPVEPEPIDPNSGEEIITNGSGNRINPLPYLGYAVGGAGVLMAKKANDQEVDPSKWQNPDSEAINPSKSVKIITGNDKGDTGGGNNDSSGNKHSQKSKHNGETNGNGNNALGDIPLPPVPPSPTTGSGMNGRQSAESENEITSQEIKDKRANIYKDLKNLVTNRYKDLKDIGLGDAFFGLDKAIELDERPIRLDYDNLSLFNGIDGRITVDNKGYYSIILDDKSNKKIKGTDLFTTLEDAWKYIKKVNNQ